MTRDEAIEMLRCEASDLILAQENVLRGSLNLHLYPEAEHMHACVVTLQDHVCVSTSVTQATECSSEMLAREDEVLARWWSTEMTTWACRLGFGWSDDDRLYRRPRTRAASRPVTHSRCGVQRRLVLASPPRHCETELSRVTPRGSLLLNYQEAVIIFASALHTR
jgi:hypothetical protein